VIGHAELITTETPTADLFQALFRALAAEMRPVTGSAEHRLLAIPLRDRAGAPIGGLWASTAFRWLNLELLFVPPALRGRGLGAALVTAAECEAAARDCLGAFVDTASFQAPGFYQRLGYRLYGVLDDFPPGHQRRYFRKCFAECRAGVLPD
jgi:GNAT superfamily N-acetyltransferase